MVSGPNKVQVLYTVICSMRVYMIPRAEANGYAIYNHLPVLAVDRIAVACPILLRLIEVETSRSYAVSGSCGAGGGERTQIY